MADVPQRIWVDALMQPWRVWTIEIPDLPPYILATPEALAAQPEVQALILAAKAEGMREAAGMLPVLLRILAAAEKLERGR